MAEPTATRRPPNPRTWRLVGVAAAVVLAVASYGSGSRPTLHTRILWPGLAWEAETGGSPLLTTVSILAMGVLAVAWWRLRDAYVSVRWWQATAALWFAPLLASVPLYSRDLYSYAAQGALWDQGLSPYEHGVQDLDSPWVDATAPTWLDATAPYGPVFLLLARAAAAVSGGDLLVALALLRILAVLSFVVIAWCVPEIAGRLGVVEPERAAWLGVAVPLMGAHAVSGAHNDAVMVAGLLVGVVLALRERFVAACVVLALAAMVKLTAVVVVPFVVLLWAGSRAPVTWGSVLRKGAAATAAVLVPIALVTVATGLGLGWLDPGRTSGRNEQWTSLPTALGMAVGAVGWLVGRPEWRATGIDVMRGVGLVVLLVVLVVGWFATARRAADRAAVVRAAGWALLAVVVLAPAVLGWYYLWALPLLAASVDPRERRGTVTALAAVATALCFAQLPDGYSLGLTTTAVGVPLALAATVVLVRAAVRWARATDWQHFLDLSASEPADGASAATLTP